MKEAWFEGTDGTKLYYRTVGEGLPIVLNDGIGCSGYVWRYLIPYLDQQKKYQFVHWHYKGHGRSDMPATLNELSIPHTARDLGKLFDLLDLPPAVIVGHSMGVQVVYEFWRQFPKRCLGLVPMCGSYGKPLDTFHDNTLLRSVFPLLHRFIKMKPSVSQKLWTLISGSELAYQVAVRFEVNGRLIERDDFLPYFEHISKVDVSLFTEMLCRAQEHSAKPFLSEIDVPVMIVGGEKDTFTPVWLSREMQRLIPEAELLIVPDGSHTAPIEMPELVNLRVEKFLRDKIEPRMIKKTVVPAKAPEAEKKPEPKAAVKPAAKPATKAPAKPKKAAPAKPVEVKKAPENKVLEAKTATEAKPKK